MVLFVTWVPDRGLRFIPRMASLAGLTWPLQLKGELLGVPFDFFKSFGMVPRNLTFQLARFLYF